MKFIYYILVSPKSVRALGDGFTYKTPMERNITSSTNLLYERLKEIECRYYDKFARIRGKVCGLSAESHGYIICEESISNLVKSKIESVILADLSNFTIEEVELSTLEIWDALKSKEEELIKENEEA